MLCTPNLIAHLNFQNWAMLYVFQPTNFPRNIPWQNCQSTVDKIYCERKSCVVCRHIERLPNFLKLTSTFGEGSLPAQTMYHQPLADPPCNDMRNRLVSNTWKTLPYSSCFQATWDMLTLKTWGSQIHLGHRGESRSGISAQVYCH